jgi:superfamily II DNA or RNA helicase
MAGYYLDPGQQFRLFSTGVDPRWRRPQLAALGAVLAQWSLAESEAPLISVPTGVGKTAIALAAPFLAAAKRVLVVVPTQELRRQTVERFRTQDVLRRIGALPADDESDPIVLEVTGRVEDWETVEDAEVVVALPASISPVHYDTPPPHDLFDLIVVDEAHHAPATTWNAILEHFTARSLLLTATPQRRDRKRLPGKLVYYYPLRQALREGLYQPVEPHILDVPAGATKESNDQLVAAKVVELLAAPEHASSQFLARAATKARAENLAALYSGLGFVVPVLHSGLGQTRQREIIDGLRDGTHRGVAMVGMLIEGFDLPSLRIAAYHDKHKSLEPTAQLIGRLARVHPDHPQRSALVTAKDIDVYPHLEGAVRDLYAEDRDWATVLPGIIDAYVEDDLKNAAYARAFDPNPGTVDLAQVSPLRRARIFEVRSDVPGWSPSYLDGEVPLALVAGEVLAGQHILYSGTSPDHSTLLIVTVQRTRPRWSSGDALDSFEYDLHIVSFRRAAQVDRPDLVLVNTGSAGAQNAVLVAIGADEAVKAGDPGRLQLAFDSLARLSVSSVGVRNTYGSTRGSPSYRMFAGSSIESGLRDSDTAQASLGHAMVQVAGDAGAYTAGVSTGKSKYWETRYTPLRGYEDFVTDFAARYWYPPAAPSGPLLPQINRGQTLVVWPAEPVIAVEVDYALVGLEWAIDGVGSLDFVELFAGAQATQLGAGTTALDRLPLAASFPDPAGSITVWTGEIDLLGQVTPTGAERAARRGHGNAVSLSDLLTDRPPMIYFLDGSTVRGREVFTPTNSVTTLRDGLLSVHDWNGVDITAETTATAAANGTGTSIHEWVENHLRTRPKRGRHRWILSNDGSGEIADHIVIEILPNSQVAVGLWHSKFAGGAVPSVRVTDFEVVTSQAIKSRRWPTDRRLWEELGARLNGAAHPEAILIEGNRRQLEVLLGLHPRWKRLALSTRTRSIAGHIAIVQPGLSKALLEAQAANGQASAVQIVQLLTVFGDAVSSVASASVVVSA